MRLFFFYLIFFSLKLFDEQITTSCDNRMTEKKKMEFDECEILDRSLETINKAGEHAPQLKLPDTIRTWTSDYEEVMHFFLLANVVRNAGRHPTNSFEASPAALLNYYHPCVKCEWIGNTRLFFCWEKCSLRVFNRKHFECWHVSQLWITCTFQWIFVGVMKTWLRQIVEPVHTRRTFSICDLSKIAHINSLALKVSNPKNHKHPNNTTTEKKKNNQQKERFFLQIKSFSWQKKSDHLSNVRAPSTRPQRREALP